MKLIDSHAHPAPTHFKNPGEVLDRARKAGVEKIIIPFDLGDWEEGLAFASEHKGFLYPAVGVHPHTATAMVGFVEQDLAGFLRSHPEVVAVGETGLDFRNASKKQRTSQEETFRKVIFIAQLFGLPLIVHSRGAHKETARVIDRGRCSRGVIHSFEGTAKEAEQYLDLGFYLSFSGLVCLSRGKSLRAAVEATPLDRLLIETDAPYLSPNPAKYPTNEPAHLPRIAKQIARWKKIDVEEVAETTYRNAAELFSLDKDLSGVVE